MVILYFSKQQTQFAKLPGEDTQKCIVDKVTACFQRLEKEAKANTSEPAQFGWGEVV